MLAVTIGFSVRIWTFAGDPDNNVYNSAGFYADVGEHFLNTLTGVMWVCKNSTPGAMVWECTTNTALVQSIIASTVQQSDWTQSNSSLQAYIKNKPVLAAVATSGNYVDLSNKPTIPAAQIQSDWTQASSGALDFIKNKPAARSQAAASRSLNAAFQVSASQWSTVRYSVDISTTVSLTGSQVGKVILEMATNAGFTTGVQELQSFTNGNSGTLVVGLVLTQLSTACLSGDIPAGNYVRLRTVNTTGAPNFTYQSGQEILI